MFFWPIMKVYNNSAHSNYLRNKYITRAKHNDRFANEMGVTINLNGCAGLIKWGQFFIDKASELYKSDLRLLVGN